MGLQHLLRFQDDVFSSESLFLFCVSTGSFSNVSQLCFFTPKASKNIREYLFMFRSSYLWCSFWKFNLNIAALFGHYFISSICWQWKMCPSSSFSVETGSPSRECLFFPPPLRISINLPIFHLLSLCSFAGILLLRWMRGVMDNDCIMAHVLLCFSFFKFSFFFMLNFFFVWK